MIPCPPPVKRTELADSEEQPVQVGLVELLNATAPAKPLKLETVIENETVLPGETVATVVVDDMLKSCTS